MRQNNGADSLNNQVDIIKKKQQAVNELIDKIALSFKTSGITKRHVDKAKKYYLNLKEVKSPLIIDEEFKQFLINIEQEMYALALNTEKNYINKLKEYNKIMSDGEEKQTLYDDKINDNKNKKEENKQEERSGKTFDEREKDRKEIILQDNESNSNNNLNKQEEFTIEKSVAKEPPSEVPSKCEKDDEDREIYEDGNNTIDELLEDKDDSQVPEKIEIVEQNSKEEKDNIPLEIIDNEASIIDLRRDRIIKLIDNVAEEYKDRGILDSHVHKAKKFYLKLLDEKYSDISDEEFEKTLKDIEQELCVLAEETKNNYINFLKEGILKNPKIDLDEKNQIMEEIYLTKSEKTKIVTKLIDRIAEEYSSDGVFDRHVKKAYGIFLNREEVLSDSLSLDEFNKFILKIEQELYSLAEQTKKNYEYYRKESESYGKVLKKGEDIK
ncbi:MAG: hypothetical protein IJO43_03755 [Bacilli bacterium]|nr:hypothetical protein [Bacilli bacterium]